MFQGLDCSAHCYRPTISHFFSQFAYEVEWHKALMEVANVHHDQKAMALMAVGLMAVGLIDSLTLLATVEALVLLAAVVGLGCGGHRFR